MGLQCKLPKSVHDDLMHLKNKTLERLTSTVLESSGGRVAVPPSPGVVVPQTPVVAAAKSASLRVFMFLLTFFGLLAFILWLTSSSSRDDEASESEEKTGAESDETSIQEVTMFSSSSGQDEDRRLMMMSAAANNNTAQRRRTTERRASPPQSSSQLQQQYPIDTIYESLAEVYEEKRSLTSESMGDVSVQETKEMLIRQTREELVRTIQQQQELKLKKQQQQQQQSKSLTAASSTGEVSSIGSGGDLVDRILDDLIADDIETYAYNKNDNETRKKTQSSSVLAKQDSTLTNKSSGSTGSQNSLLSLYNVRHVNAIEDRFRSLPEVSAAIKEAGLEKGQLIFGIDFTISNLENGARTFGGRSLHHYEEGLKNPYQKVIEIMGKTLEVFDLDGRIPAFGFGDAETKDRKVFSFSNTGYCLGFQDVLNRYNEILKTVTLSGPTNFAPLIKQAIKIVKETRQYHILVIVADGQVTNERQTRDAIVEASRHALSIIMVGVGDGPWDTMNEFDDSLPRRQFDNFQFVNYHEVCEQCPGNPDEAFALHALMEIPDQFKTIRELKLLDKLK